MGDLLFAAVNLARFLHIDPEIALKKANAKFSTRFRRMEAIAAESGKALADVPREQMEEYWGGGKARRERGLAEESGGAQSLMSEKIFVRKCAGIDEFQRCVDLQKEIWGEEDIEVEPATLFVVASETEGKFWAPSTATASSASRWRLWDSPTGLFFSIRT